MDVTTTNLLPNNIFHYKCKCGFINSRKGYNYVFLKWCGGCGKELNYTITLHIASSELTPLT